MRGEISAIMTRRVFTVSLEDSVRTAYQIMQGHRIRHLPVRDGVGNIIGIISDRDVMRAIEPVGSNRSWEENTIEINPEFRVKEFMSFPVITILDETPLIEAVRTMLREKISAVLIETLSHRVRGILTTEDLMRLLELFLNDDPESAQISLGSVMGEYEGVASSF